MFDNIILFLASIKQTKNAEKPNFII
jgi:hypothetical protein